MPPDLAEVLKRLDQDPLRNDKRLLGVPESITRLARQTPEERFGFGSLLSGTVAFFSPEAAAGGAVVVDGAVANNARTDAMSGHFVINLEPFHQIGCTTARSGSGVAIRCRNKPERVIEIGRKASFVGRVNGRAQAGPGVMAPVFEAWGLAY